MGLPVSIVHQKSQKVLVRFGEPGKRSIPPRSESPPGFVHPGQTPPDEMPYAVKSPLGQKPPRSKCFLSI